MRLMSGFSGGSGASPSATTPLGDLATAAVGTSLNYARADHVHPGREVLTANRTYFVLTTGSDSNTGLVNTSGGAFLTIQKAIDTAIALDLAIYNVTIQVGDGTYTGAVVLKSYLGAGPIILQGNTTTPSNVVISTTSADAINAGSVEGTWKIDGFKLQTTTSGYGLNVANSFVDHYRVNYGACANGHIAASGHAKVYLNSNITVSGGSGGFLFAINQGVIIAQAALTVTMSGTPAFSGQTVNATNMGEISIGNITWSGAATGTRFNSSGLAALITGGTSGSIPGNVAGTGTTPGTSPFGLVT
jgi:hypothetical protein